MQHKAIYTKAAQSKAKDTRQTIYMAEYAPRIALSMSISFCISSVCSLPLI